jgi:hypothetical protein
MIGGSATVSGRHPTPSLPRATGGGAPTRAARTLADRQQRVRNSEFRKAIRKPLMPSAPSLRQQALNLCRSRVVTAGIKGDLWWRISAGFRGVAADRYSV